MAFLNGNGVSIHLKYSDVDEEKAVMNEMWESIQVNGTRTRYDYAFTRSAYNKKTFKPVFDIKPANVADMFSYISCDEKVAVNMVELEQEQGITFDFSSCTSFLRTFAGDLFLVLSTVDLSKATNLQYTFYQGYASDRNLTRIERLVCSATTNFHTSTFNLATKLTYIGFEGVIAKTITLTSCPLVKESILMLFACLSDSASSVSVSLNLNAVNNAFETSKGALDGSTSEEWLNLVATKPNWTVSLS